MNARNVPFGGIGTAFAFTKFNQTEAIMINEYFTMIDDYMAHPDPQDPNAPKDPDAPNDDPQDPPSHEPDAPIRNPDADPYPVTDPPIDPDVAPPVPVDDPPAGEPGSIPTYPPDVVF